MSSEQNKEWVEKAIPVLKEFLTTEIGYPHCTKEQIMDRLPQMWERLYQNNLIRPGMTYQQFIHEAQEKYMQFEINRILGL